jgi:hypothetical protein
VLSTLARDYYPDRILEVIIFGFTAKHFLESKKNPPTYSIGGFITPGTGLSFREVSLQVLSLLTVFTVVFGMGTGVFRSLWHQEPLGYTVTIYGVNTVFGSDECGQTIYSFCTAGQALPDLTSTLKTAY